MSADPLAPTGVRDETIQHAPIHAALVALRHQSGRTVPGRSDRERSRPTTPPRFATPKSITPPESDHPRETR